MESSRDVFLELLDDWARLSKDNGNDFREDLSEVIEAEKTVWLYRYDKAN